MADEDDLKDLPIPGVPLLLNFPHITRRVAAQRSRFIVFRIEPTWLADELTNAFSPIKTISIEGSWTSKLRAELRDSGVTESVIFPDLDGLGREINQLWEDRKWVDCPVGVDPSKSRLLPGVRIAGTFSKAA